MWSLIHTLQIYRYILLINIKMPRLIDIFLKFLAITIGEVDEVESLMPDWFSLYIIDPSDLRYDTTLHSRFENNGKFE